MTAPLIAQRVERHCQGNHERRTVEGSATAATAYYPNGMARRVIRAMKEHSEQGTALDGIANGDAQMGFTT
eukprot:5503424-Alexandrium_andersonii.AAC.1